MPRHRVEQRLPSVGTDVAARGLSFSIVHPGCVLLTPVIVDPDSFECPPPTRPRSPHEVPACYRSATTGETNPSGLIANTEHSTRWRMDSAVFPISRPGMPVRA